MSVAGKTVVITGGSTGIGFEVIKTLLARGAKNVAILDINDTDNASTKLQELYPNGQTVLYLKTNVADRDNVWRSFGEVKSRFGQIDVVIGNAGLVNENNPELTIQVNLIGIINSTYAAIEFLGKPNGGNGGIVLNIASVAGLDHFSPLPSYTASKHGVLGLTRSFADENHKHLGITFLAICPGVTVTPIFDDISTKLVTPADGEEMKRITTIMPNQTPAEAANAIGNLLEKSNEASIYIVDEGKSIPVTLPNYWKKF